MSTVRVGLIGSQFAATLHVEALAQVARAEVIAACGLVGQQVQEFCAQHHIPHAYTDYQELLARPDIDLVCLSKIGRAHV